MAQSFVKLISIPAGPAPDAVKKQIVGLVFPQVSGFMKQAFDETHGIEDNKVNISGSDFLSAIYKLDNGDEIAKQYMAVFGNQLSLELITFNKSECEEIVL